MTMNRLTSTRAAGWQEKVFYNGERTSIVDMVTKHGHTVEHDGNSKDGWFVFLRDANGIGLSISPFFGREQGDTLRDLKAAFVRMYGTEIKLRRGRNYW